MSACRPWRAGRLKFQRQQAERAPAWMLLSICADARAAADASSRRSPMDSFPKIRFALDSPLEERVSSEPVSEVRAWDYGTIPRGLWMITEAEKGYSGLENGGISVFAPWQLLRLS